MSSKRHLTSSLFLIMTICLTQAQHANYYFRSLNTENGLSQNTVLSILQDQTGFMWFGTKDGLNKYDGNKITVYRQNENQPRCLGNNTIWSLLELPDGTIWAGTDRGIYIYNPHTDGFHFFSKKADNGHTITNSVLDMKLDGNGNVWISCHNLYKYSTKTEKLEIVLHMKEELHDSVSFEPRTWSINIDNDNQIWVSLLEGGLKRIDPEKQQITSYEISKKECQISNTVNIGNNHLLIGSFDKRLKMLNKTNGNVQDYPLGHPFEHADLFVRTMKCFSDQNIWIGTESGLYIHDPISHHTTHLCHNLYDRCSLSDNAIYSMYEDREGGIWIGTYFGGVNYFPLPYTHFRKYYPIPGKNSLSGERVSGLCQDQEGNIWIGTEDAGLNKLDLKTMQFEHIAVSNENKGLNYHNVHDIILDGEDLWIATFSRGINVFNLKSKKWKYYQKSEKYGALKNNDIFALYKDSSDRIWVGTSSGLFLYDKEHDLFTTFEQIRNEFVSDITEDTSGQIWIATYTNGAYRYNPRTQEIQNYRYNPVDSTSICYHKITCLYVSQKGQLWIGGESNGICAFDENANHFVRYGQCLPSGSIYKILDDHEGNLWISSNSGLIRFDPDTRKMQIFTQSNGLPSNQFNYKSGYKGQDGTLYFGSLNGLVSFSPGNFNPNKHIPPVVITNFELLEEDIPQRIHQSNMKNISLKHNQSSFSINFAALSYVAPEMNRYAYKMTGLDDGWHHLLSPQKIIYSNLPHGKYTFQVKACNNDGIWNDHGDTLGIVITPPIWQTKWAYLAYMLSTIAMITFILRYYTKQIENKNRQQQQAFELEKEKEIYSSKIEFFTNIAHEVRTPLTLIKGPLEYIIKNEIGQDELKSNLSVMEKNTDRLLSLVNQLLDFRKTESENFSLTFTHVDVVELLNETYSRFEPLARQKGLIFELSSPQESILIDIDREAITKVISNLFTNAIKYAHSCIFVDLRLNDKNCQIKVSNDGERISEEIKEKIFEPFFQGENKQNEIKSGSGIGLALVRALVELHEGCVFLDTNDPTFTSFVVTLPKEQKRVFELAETPTGLLPIITSPNHTKRHFKKEPYNLLLVDDNDDMLQFLSEKLSKQYVVFQARNGMEALKILAQEVINLIISDIIMPQMDGFELCATIKNNAEFSHIPVILLTAKTNVQSKVTGLESGADAYIEKPFSLEHLVAQISNLLNNRRKIREAFANSPLVHTGSIALTKSDEQFLNKLTEMVQMNISNADFNFNIDHLAEEFCMSRSSFLRKIKGITGVTPNDFIRLIRLKKAAEILQEGEYKVNEVCYLVGFSSTSYFTKAFQKQFGILPRDFVKKLRGEE